MIVRRYSSRVDSGLAPIQGRMKEDPELQGKIIEPASIIVIMGVEMCVDQPGMTSLFSASITVTSGDDGAALSSGKPAMIPSLIRRFFR